MSEFFFVIKTAALTLVILLLLQIKVSNQTLEQRSLTWMHESTSIGALRGVADGASLVIDNTTTWIQHFFEKQFSAKKKDNSAELQHRRKQRERAWKNEVGSPDSSDDPDPD